MSLQWIEGFESFGLGLTGSTLETELQKKYTTVDITFIGDGNINTGRSGGRALEWDNENHFISKLFVTSGADFTIGFAYFTPASFASDRTLIQILDGAFVQIYLRRSVAGNLEIWTAGVFRDAAVAVFSSQQWYYIELKGTISDTGSYEVKINGSTVLSDGSVDTRFAGSNPGTNGFKFTGDNDGSRIDDIYVQIGAGSDFYGEVKVDAHRPDGDTGNRDWGRSSGSDNYALVDDDNSDDDSTYVQSSVIGDKDLYTYSDILFSDHIVLGIQINTEARVTDASSKNLSNIIRQDQDEEVAVSQIVSDAVNYKNFVDVYEENPITSSAWVLADFNNTLFGFQDA